jgi:hypothetical protein
MISKAHIQIALCQFVTRVSWFIIPIEGKRIKTRAVCKGRWVVFVFFSFINMLEQKREGKQGTLYFQIFHIQNISTFQTKRNAGLSEIAKLMWAGEQNRIFFTSFFSPWN